MALTKVSPDIEFLFMRPLMRKLLRHLRSELEWVVVIGRKRTMVGGWGKVPFDSLDTLDWEGVAERENEAGQYEVNDSVKLVSTRAPTTSY